MAQLFELKQNRQAALAKADNILKIAEAANRGLTDAESAEVDSAMAEAQDLTPRIVGIEKQNTLRLLMTGGMLLPPTDGHGGNAYRSKAQTLSSDYSAAFHAWMQSGGQNAGAALYEGSNSQGGLRCRSPLTAALFRFPPAETGVRLVATVLTTTNDVKVPRQATSSTGRVQGRIGCDNKQLPRIRSRRWMRSPFQRSWPALT